MQPKGSIFTAKTLDEAVRKGLDELRLERADVMITVLEEGSGGFLGIGARPYKVRVIPRGRREPVDDDGRRPREGREREGRGDRGGRGGRGRPASRSGAAEPRSAGGGETRGDGRGERRGSGRREGRGEPRTAGAERRSEPREPRSTIPPESKAEPRPETRPGQAAQSPRHEPGGDGSRRRRRRNGRSPDSGRVEGAPGPIPPAIESAHTMSREETRTAVAEPEAGGLSGTELAESGRSMTEGLLRAMGFVATVTAHAEDSSVEVKAEVPQDADLLVGHKGEVRQALQHILNRMINRSQPGRYHLHLEINDFWEQREGELQALARSMADAVASSGTEQVTEYLNAQERRVIHVTLREETRVRTYAIGDGLIKKVAIAPADQAEETQEDL